jgi:hypothetical protein
MPSCSYKKKISNVSIKVNVCDDRAVTIKLRAGLLSRAFRTAPVFNLLMQAIVEALIGTRKVENVNADFWEDTTQHCIPYIFRSGCQVFRTIKSSALREQKRKKDAN